MTIQFDRPVLLLAVCLAAVPIIIYAAARRSGRSISPFSLAMQIAVIVLAAAALSAPSVSTKSSSQASWLIIRDVSASTRTQQDGKIPFPSDVSAKHIEFASSIISRKITRKNLERDGLSKSAELNATDISIPLRFAAASKPAPAGIVIVTDGQFTDGSWQSLAVRIAGMKTDVFIVPLDSAPPDGRIAKISATRRADGKVNLQISASSNAFFDGRTLTVRRIRPAAKTLFQQKITLTPSNAISFQLSDTLPTLPAPSADAAVSYIAQLSEADKFPENDSSEVTVLPRKGTAAFVSAGKGGAIIDAIEKRLHLNVETLSPPACPDGTNGRRWSDYSVVILADASGTLLTPRQRTSLARYVRSGGGLFLIGAGPHGNPQDRNSPLNRILPLVPDPFERKPLKVIVVLDASGSMNEQTSSADQRPRKKFDLSSEAVLSLKKQLTRHDSLSVFTFNDKTRCIYDSGDAPADFSALRDALLEIHPAGPTDMFRAIQISASPPPKGKTGIMILLGDLLPNSPIPFDPQKSAKTIADANLTLAIVETRGADTSQTTPLRKLAKILNAPIASREHLKGLAQVFAGFLRRARGDVVRRGDFTVRFPSPPFNLAGVRSLKLAEYILCSARDDADAMGFVGDDCILARSTAGLGKSVALAISPDALPAGDGLLELSQAAVAWCARAEISPDFYGDANLDGNGLSVILNARNADGPINLLDLRARITSLADPAAKVREIPLTQTAPGRYSLVEKFPAIIPSRSVAISIADKNGKILWRGVADKTYHREFDAIGANWDNLRLLAELAGGEIVSREGLPSLVKKRLASRRIAIGWWLITLSCAMMLLEWSLTRVTRKGY